METHDHLEEWVNTRVAAVDLPPGWPDENVARRRLERHIAERRPRRIVLWVAVTAAVFAAVVVLPQSRATAERLWDQVFLGRLQVLIADGSGAAASFFSPELKHSPEARPVASVEEASRAAGYAPRLPGPGVFATSPRYSVTEATSATLQLRTPGIRYLVARAGGSAGEVPDAWNGALLEVRIGPVVVADYAGILLLQSRPFELITPANFDLEAFYRIAFRSLGISERDARTLSTDLRISPALLTFMPKEDEGLVHEFKSRLGTGVLIDEVYGHGKTLAVWSGADRLYALFLSTGHITREFAMEVANALD